MSAIISADGVYRYRLERELGGGGPVVAIFGVNPSTADAQIDDPTIRSCYRLVNALGYGSFEVVNLFAWRATDPNDLAASPDPIGNPKNADVVQKLQPMGQPTDGIRVAAVSPCLWGSVIPRLRVPKPDTARGCLMGAFSSCPRYR